MRYSVVQFSKVREAEDFRIDSDYFHPDYLKTENIILSTKWDYLNKLSLKISDFGAYSQTNIVDYKTSGKYIFIRNQDIEGFFINGNERVYVDDSVYKQLSLHLDKHDIVIQRAGTLGKAGIIFDEDLPSTANQNLAQIRVNKKRISPFYLIAFLNSDVGIRSFGRLKTGNVQPWLNLKQIKTLKIPLFSDVFQGRIEEAILKAHLSTLNVRNKYQQAEQILLSELGLLDWKPKHQLSFVRNFSDTKSADRIDAEYFQPIYAEIIYNIRSYRKGWDKLGNLFQRNKRKFKIIADKMYEYVEISCVSISDGAIKPLIVYGNQLPPNAKVKLLKEDIIVSKVRPYRGAVGIVDSDNYVGSSAFTVLQPSGSINKETLVTLLRTKPYLQLSLKFNTGTSYPTITDNDILNLEIPLIPNDIQESVKKKIQKANANRACAKSLLDIAKRGVEMAIEKSEEEAEKWLSEEVVKCQITM